MTKENFSQYKKYIQSLSLETIKKLQKDKENKVENESHILRKRGIFEQVEKELTIIDEVLEKR